MMSIFDFIVISLACWRITSLFVAEDGPGEILAKFRNWVGVRYDERSRPYGKNVFAKAMLCIWCFSVWVCLMATLLAIPANIHKYIIWLLMPFALSTMVIVLDSFISR